MRWARLVSTSLHRALEQPKQAVTPPMVNTWPSKAAKEVTVSRLLGLMVESAVVVKRLESLWLPGESRCLRTVWFKVDNTVIVLLLGIR